MDTLCRPEPVGPTFAVSHAVSIVVGRGSVTTVFGGRSGRRCPSVSRRAESLVLGSSVVLTLSPDHPNGSISTSAERPASDWGGGPESSPLSGHRSSHRCRRRQRALWDRCAKPGHVARFHPRVAGCRLHSATVISSPWRGVIRRPIQSPVGLNRVSVAPQLGLLRGGTTRCAGLSPRPARRFSRPPRVDGCQDDRSRACS